MQLNKENGLHGTPDLVIEILSPATATYDLEEKKDVYEQNGVKEYCIINPAGSSVTGYPLREGSFVLLMKSTGSVKSELPDWSVDF